LRTYRMDSPFPEEFNRVVISKISTFHFAPTEKNRENLIRELVDRSAIHVTGNTVIDALNWIIRRLDNDVARRTEEIERIKAVTGFDVTNTKYVLVTGHRRESFGNGLIAVFSGLRELARGNPNLQFVYPVHLNPIVREVAEKILGNLDNFRLTEPFEYESFSVLMANCVFIVTDSGGIQEEAPSLGKPVLVTREVTERPEALASGLVQLVGLDSARLVAAGREIIANLDTVSRHREPIVNPYGDGRACERIVSVLKQLGSSAAK